MKEMYSHTHTYIHTLSSAGLPADEFPSCDNPADDEASHRSQDQQVCVISSLPLGL